MMKTRSDMFINNVAAIAGVMMMMMIWWTAPSEASNKYEAAGTIEEQSFSSDPTVKLICELTEDPATCQAVTGGNPEAIFDSFDVNDPINVNKLNQLVHPALRNICNGADDPEVCAFAYYLSGGTNDAGVSDVSAVLRRLIQSTVMVCMRDQREAVQFGGGLRREAEGERVAVYATCSDQFVKAAAEMTLAAQAMEKGDMDRAMHNVNETIAHNDYCDEIMHHATYHTGIPINDPGMVKLITHADTLHLFASNCMALLEILKHNKV